MQYDMTIHVDGGCRRNGAPNAIGAAAAVLEPNWGQRTVWVTSLPQYPRPTSQRAEITAIILALEKTLVEYDEKGGTPWDDFDVIIHSDSNYAVTCMTEWIDNWSRNGWRTAAGGPVRNQDLMQEASNLDDILRTRGTVRYYWIRRSENVEADRACREQMDKDESDRAVTHII